jgi:hypothetical protein
MRVSGGRTEVVTAESLQVAELPLVGLVRSRTSTLGGSRKLAETSMQGLAALDTGPLLLRAETPLRTGDPPLVAQLSMQGQRPLVQLLGLLLVAPLARHVPEVDQGQRHPRAVAQFPVNRKALLA